MKEFFSLETHTISCAHVEKSLRKLLKKTLIKSSSYTLINIIHHGSRSEETLEALKRAEIVDVG